MPITASTDVLTEDPAYLQTTVAKTKKASACPLGAMRQGVTVKLLLLIENFKLLFQFYLLIHNFPSAVSSRARTRIGKQSVQGAKFKRLLTLGFLQGDRWHLTACTS